jgi:PPOX class probable F420-dependent enzyme
LQRDPGSALARIIKGVPNADTPWSPPARAVPGPTRPWDSAVRRFLESQPRFATLATIDPDGSPLLAVVWYLVADEGIVVNSREGRRWPANLRRDPRASISVERAYDYVAIKATAEILGDAASAQGDIAAMARRYKTPEEARQMIDHTFASQTRISFLLRPRSVVVHGRID